MASDPKNPSLETLRRIDAICDEYESALKRGENPVLNEYLEKAPVNERSLLFKGLVEIKLELHTEDSFDGIEDELTSQYSDEKETISQLISAAKSRKIQYQEETRYQKSDLTDPEINDQKHPRKIGRFNVKKILGKGGFGTVYKALDPSSKQTVAIKVPLDSTLNSEENLKRFVREGEIASELNHPGICPVYEVSSDKEIPFIVMKYIEGPSMSDIHKQMNSKNRLMNIPKSVNLIRNIGEAIEYAHLKGVIHRDLKPANIIWDKEQSTPLITDFGLARYWKTNESDLTVTGQGMGTPAYIAPEQARGHNKDLGKQVDVYSLGVIFYELLCGERPFPGKDFDVVIQKSAEDPPPPSKFRPEIDSQLDAICLTVIARSTEDRFQSVQEFLDALEKYQAGDDFSFPEGQKIALEAEDDWNDDEDDLLGLNPITQNQKSKIADKSKKTLAEFRESFNIDFDPYYRWLGITSKQRPVSYYQLLGISKKEQDSEAIFNAAERQKMNVKAFQGDTERYVVARILYEIEEACFILLDDDYRQQYDKLMKEKKKKRSWERRYQNWRREALKNSELPKEYIYVSQSSGFVEEFLKVFAIIFIGFGLMAWYSFSSWPKPKGHGNYGPNIAVNVPDKQQPVAPKPFRKRKPLGNPKKKKPDNKAPNEVKVIDANSLFDIAKLKLTNEWIDLLPSIDIEKHKLQGDWKKEKGVLTAGDANQVNSIPAAVHLPLQPLDSYQLEIEFSLLNINSDFMVYFPVASKSCRLGIYGNWTEIDQILNEEKRHYNTLPVEKFSFSKKHTGRFPIIKNNLEVGRYNNSTSKYPNKYGFGKYLDDGNKLEMVNNRKYHLLIEIKSDKRMAVITAKLDGKPVMDWTGPIKDIASSNEYKIHNKVKNKGIVIAHGTTKASQAEYYQIRIRKQNSQKIITPESIIKSPYYKNEPKFITKSEKQIKNSQRLAAKKHNTKNNTKNSIGMKLTLIPAGTFTMGSSEFKMGSKKKIREKFRTQTELPHPVNISNPFFLGTFEVTRGQFRQFVEETKYITDAENNINGGWGYDKVSNKFINGKEYHWRNPGFPQTDKHPVVNVSWNDAIAFCKWLSNKENKSYRLPTEAEWEYSCKAGTATYYYFSEHRKKYSEYANIAHDEFKEMKPNNSKWGGGKTDGYVFTAPVGTYKPNAFGLHDTHGNVFEWCHDTKVPHAYFLLSEVVAVDPHVTVTGDKKIMRGGSWYQGVMHSSAAHRGGTIASGFSGSMGFRIARDL